MGRGELALGGGDLGLVGVDRRRARRRGGSPDADPPEPDEPVEVGSSSSSRRAWSEARVADASSTDAWRLAVPSPASVWPAVTACPTVANTLVTSPETSKFTSAWLTASMVPEAETVCSTVPVPAVANV